MPPRSVCLNVFTTSLGQGGVGKEADVMIREVEERKNGGIVEERGRHDSVQEDELSTATTTTTFTQTIAPTNRTPVTPPATFGAASPASDAGSPSANPFLSSTSPSICSTCARPPPFGHSLLRCSRCKCAYYCSRTCQKQAWKLHKTECDPVSAPSPSTVLDTPDVSIPSSPAHVTEAPQFNLTAEIIRDAPSQCDAIHDAVYTASPAEQRDTF